MGLARIICAALFFISMAVAADDFAQWRDAVARGDYSAAVPALQVAADHDDPRALCLLASLYQKGEGFPHDAAKALALYTRAAELGDAEGQFHLGNIYLLGDGVQVDEAWALTYYRQAAAQGHAGAARNLDELYRASGLSPAPPSTSPPTQPRPGDAARPQAQPPVAPDPALTGEQHTPFPEPQTAAASGPSADELRALALARAAGVEVVLDETVSSPAVAVVPITRPPVAIADRQDAPADASSYTNSETVEYSEEGTAAYATAQQYLRGRGVALDPAIGIQWLQRAARAGHLQAKYELALCYLNGRGVTADEAMAITLLRDAAEAGDSLARAKLQQVYTAAGLQMPVLKRPRLPVAPAPTMNPEIKPATHAAETALATRPSPGAPAATLADARAALDAHDLARAAAIFTTLANAGDAEAQAHIGYMTYQGEGVPVDKATAVQWYRKAAVQGNRDAQYNLAVAHAFGDGVARNDAEALLWYHRAAEQGSAVAQYSLGVSYALGEGAAQSDEEALKWYRAAAAQGYADAQYNLGEMLGAGRGAPANERDALHWCREAARNGNAAAQHKLGTIYRDGRGVERDLSEAMHWYKLAAAQGHRDAQADLVTLQTKR
jgi:TPR repeat protein